MATLRDIQRRIRSVQSTQKITRAMKLVAAAKLRRAQERILSARPYATKMAELLGNLVSGTRRRRASAARAARGAPASDRDRHGGQGTGRRVQLEHHPAVARAHPRVERRGPDAGRGRPQGARLLPPPAVHDQARPDRVLGPPGLQPRLRAGGLLHGAVPGRRGRRGVAALQRVPLGGGPAARCACSSCRSRGRKGEAAETVDYIYEPARRRSWASCCRATCACRSTGRSWSRWRASTAPG